MKRTSLSSFVAAVALAGVYLSPASAQTGNIAVEVLSSRPDFVTGGDALIKISGVDAAPQISVNGADVSSAFSAHPDGGWIGLVTGLVDGENILVATGAGGEASLTLVNHPVNGPLFSGPLQQPFVCENEDHGLDPATDDTCSAPAKVEYYYRNAGGEWLIFDPEGDRPGDIGKVMIDGEEVPLIVRRERGVINRAAYMIAILHDPAAGALPTPVARGASGWNGKLVYSFGGGVQANYHMGRNLGMMSADHAYLEDTGGGFLDLFITRGYAVATASLNVMGTNNNDVLSAETVAKVKERFIEQFGVPEFTIGHGASGGSMQQHLIGHNYPGLLDGIMPMRSYPDVMTFLQPLYDCELLVKVFETGEWTEEQKDAVSGKHFGYCKRNGARYPNARPSNCDPIVLDALANEEKPLGTRCTFQDNLANIFGTGPAEGAVDALGNPVEAAAPQIFDNVGVQYGLKALNEGVISFEQFIDINSRIGGLDINGKIVAERTEADAEAIKTAYATGRVNSGGAGLALIPIVDIRSYTDGPPPAPHDPTDVDVHDGYHSAVMRARLIAANGHANNHVILTAGSLGRTQLDTRTRGSALTAAAEEGLTKLDQWLEAIKADTSDKPQAQKVVDNRPADFVDACYPAIEGWHVGAYKRETDLEKCGSIFRFAADARLAAGAPATNDIFKCTLKPVDPADYKALSAEQIEKIKEVFPDGVCDYSKPGVGQVGPAGVWIAFSDGAYGALEQPQ